MPYGAVSQLVYQVAAERGWSDDTIIAILTDYLELSVPRMKVQKYLAYIIAQEDSLSSEPTS